MFEATIFDEIGGATGSRRRSDVSSERGRAASCTVARNLRRSASRRLQGQARATVERLACAPKIKTKTRFSHSKEDLIFRLWLPFCYGREGYLQGEKKRGRVRRDGKNIFLGCDARVVEERIEPQVISFFDCIYPALMRGRDWSEACVTTPPTWNLQDEAANHLTLQPDEGAQGVTGNL